MLPILAALAAGLVADGSVRVDGRAGSTDGGQDPNGAGVSADLVGRTSGPDGVLRFGASPRVVFAQGRELFARAFGEADLRLRESAWVRLRQSLGYGSIDLSPLATREGPGPVLPPAGARFVAVQESDTSLELDVATSRRLRLTGSAAWQVNGGASTEARESFPLSRGPLLRASAIWAATRVDLLRLDVQAFDYRYSNGRRASVASLAAGWRMQLARSTDLSVSLGPGIGRAQLEDEPARTLVYAVGTADFRAALARGVVAAIGAGVEPLGDPLTGELVERGSVRASATWERPRSVGVAARLVGSVALTSGTSGPTSPQAGDQYLQAEVAATFPLDPHSTISAGARAALVSRPVLDQPSNQWVAFVAYGAQVPLLR